MGKRIKAMVTFSLMCSILLALLPVRTVKADSGVSDDAQQDKTVTLRICNWEEYIDLGDWDEEETIDLDSGDIIGENSMVKDFEEW